MVKQFTVKPIGFVRINADGMQLVLEEEVRPALTNMDGFTHFHVLWWFDGCDTAEARTKLVEESPYCGSPHLLGTFATRSPERPNPIALSCVRVLGINADKGIVEVEYIDAEDNSPILDIKPYTPSLDRVAEPGVPAWCADWPPDVETSGDFDWGSVFRF